MHVQRNDDTANMRETIRRRFSEKNRKDWGMPDLLLIDGGKGQLSAVLDELDKLDVTVPVIGIAKREEEIVVAKNCSHINDDDALLGQLMKEPRLGISVLDSGDFYLINLHAGQQNAGSHSRNLRGSDTMGEYDDVVKLFQRIRDEAHRFAVSYHTTLKRKGATKSELDDIPGVGPATRRKLLRRFGSMRAVRRASQTEICDAIGQALGTRVYEAFCYHGGDMPQL